MIKEKHLPNEYWAEAVACSVYILNRCPTKAVINKTPEEAWSKRKHKISHLRVFGCVAYSLIPQELRRKLDDKGEKFIFVGYSEHSKAYKLYNPITKMLIISRDVEFLEEEAWDGRIDKINTSTPSVLQENEEDEIQAKNPSTQENAPATPSRASSTPNPTTPTSNNSSESSNPTLASLRSRSINTSKKTRSLREIYDETQEAENADFCCDFAFLTQADPIYFEEAIKEDKWIAAMDEEIQSIEKNETWDLVEVPKGKDVTGVKWVYKTKYNVDGKVAKHKARLVAKGFTQKLGIDFNETFAPMARLDTIRMVLSIAAQNKWKVYQMDIRSTFLNGILEEEVYVNQPPGYEVLGEEHKVCRLKKALYGLKQAPRASYSRIDSYFVDNGFNKCGNEPTLYVKMNDEGEILIVCLYVEDLIFTANMQTNTFKVAMKKEFDMTDLGLMRYFLGMEVSQNDQGIFICQSKYANDLLKRFKMTNVNSAPTLVALGLKLSKDDQGPSVDATLFKRLVGSLMYLTSTRPDIMFGVSLISRFMDKPKESHWRARKRILRYIAGTKNFGILYTFSDDCKLIGYTDSDWGGSMDDRKSTFGYIFHLGSGAVSWASKKQPIVTLSSAEAEYVAATSASCQAVWLRRVLSDLGHHQEEPTKIYYDNNSAIALSKNHVFHKRSKHIDTRYHFIRELVSNGNIYLQFCRSNEQVADIFTKPLAKNVFEHLREEIGIANIHDSED
jgi:hypothetical protein